MKNIKHQKIIEDAKKSGFIRARIDGVMADLEENIKLDKQKKHTIEIVVDRIINGPDIRTRLADSIEIGLKNANGIIIVTKRRVEKILVLLPIITRDSMSLPYLSVPNRCSADGPAFAFERSCQYGS